MSLAGLAQTLGPLERSVSGLFLLPRPPTLGELSLRIFLSSLLGHSVSMGLVGLHVRVADPWADLHSDAIIHAHTHDNDMRWHVS